MSKLVIEKVIEKTLRGALRNRGIEAPEVFPEDYVLLASGLDSLGFAILVTQLEESLGYDPFTLMDEPVYPRIYKEFKEVYTRFSDHLDLDETY